MNLKRLTIVVIFSIITSNVFSQTVNFNEHFTSDTIISLASKYDGTCNSSKVFANITLNSDTSLVRIIMVDDHGIRRLLFETYPLISSSYTINLNDFADETMYLPNNTKPETLEVFIIDAECSFSEMIFANIALPESELLAKEHKNNIERQKVTQINENLEERGLLWRAKLTELSLLNYQTKVDLFGGDKYNLEAYDYYSGGIFSNFSTFNEMTNVIFTKPSNDTLPTVKTKSFDWRKTHDANIPESPYWDGDNDIHNLWNNVGEYQLREYGNG